MIKKELLESLTKIIACTTNQNICGGCEKLLDCSRDIKTAHTLTKTNYGTYPLSQTKKLLAKLIKAYLKEKSS